MDVHDRRVAKARTRDAIDDQQYMVVRGADGQGYAVPKAVVEAAEIAILEAHQGGSRG